MECPNCKTEMQKVMVKVGGAREEVVSFQCRKCKQIDFEPESARRVVQELKMKETPLKIKQKIIKLSKDRLGTYFNSNVVRSLGLKPGEEVYVSVPDKKHIIISREE